MSTPDYFNLLVKSNFLAWLKNISDNDSDQVLRQAAKEIAYTVSGNTSSVDKPYYEKLYLKYKFKLIYIKTNDGIIPTLYFYNGKKTKLIGSIQKNPYIPPKPSPRLPDVDITYRFGYLGDSGYTTIANCGNLAYLQNTKTVAEQIQSYNPDWVIHIGDANYCGVPEVMTNFLNFWSNYNYANNMYIAFGNHDLDYDYGATILNKLTTVKNLIGPTKVTNKLYCYDFVRGPVHFFVFNSGNTAAGNSMNEAVDLNIQLASQIAELQPKIEASTSPWKVVLVHRPPFTSEASHRTGSAPMRFNYAAMGVDLVLSGHSHNYEYITQNNVQYFVQGLGGATLRCATTPYVDGEIINYCTTYGYSICEVNKTTFKITSYNIAGVVIDTRTFTK